MQLISIETTNFKKLRRFQASFRQGLNAIVGDNAKGKSTLLQAIEAALYGSTVVPGKKDKIPTWGQSTWKIELTFVAKGDRYRLTRSKTTAKLELVSDAGEPQLIANGNTPVTAAVTELLDLDAKDYNLFMQSKQGETTGVLTFGAAALNRKVEEFAGISLIDRVQNLAQEEFRIKRSQADALAVAAEELERAEQQVDLLAEVALNAEGAAKAAQEALDALPLPEDLEAPGVDPDALQRRLDTIVRLRSRIENAELQVKHARQLHQEAVQRFEELDTPDDADELEQQMDALQAEIRPAVKAVNDLQRELSRQEQLWAKLVEAEKVMDADRPEDEIGEELTAAVERITEVEELSQEATRRWHGVGHRIQQIQEMRDGAECPTCGTQLSEHDPAKLDEEHAELVATKGTIKAERDELDKRFRDLDGRRRKLEKELEQAQFNETRVDQLRDELDSLGVDLTSAESPVEKQLAEAEERHRGLLIQSANLEHRMEQSEAAWRAYRRAEKATQQASRELDAALATLAGEQDRLSREDAKGVPTEEGIEAARRAVRWYETEKNQRKVARLEAKSELDKRWADLQNAGRELERAKTVLEDLRYRSGQATQAAKEADQAGRLARFLRDRRAGYLQEVWDAVLGAASKQVALASKGMISRIVFDDGDFLYEEDGVLAPVTSASGAQKAHIGVAIRIGLARALYGSDALLIFDEPTESMSEHHASGLSASLAGAAAQCLLITHRDQDQDLAAHVIEVAA